MIRLFLGREDVNLNALFQNMTSLQIAVQDNREDTVELLLSDKRINPDLTVLLDGGTPLLWALVSETETIAELLLNAVANKNIYDWTWISPAMLMEAPNAEARRALLEKR